MKELKEEKEKEEEVSKENLLENENNCSEESFAIKMCDIKANIFFLKNAANIEDKFHLQ